MAADKLDTGSATLFNAHMVDVGNRLGTFCNYLILIDGGILSITIGAFIGPAPPSVPLPAFAAIQAGWYLLTIGLILALATTFTVLMAQMHVHWKMRKSFVPEPKTLKLHTGPEWVGLAVRVTLWLAFTASVVGIGTVSYGAVQMLKPAVSATK